MRRSAGVQGQQRGFKGANGRAGAARKLGRLTGLLMEGGRAAEAQPLLRRMLAATEEEHVRFVNPVRHTGSPVSSFYSEAMMRGIIAFLVTVPSY